MSLSHSPMEKRPAEEAGKDANKKRLRTMGPPIIIAMLGTIPVDVWPTILRLLPVDYIVQVMVYISKRMLAMCIVERRVLFSPCVKITRIRSSNFNWPPPPTLGQNESLILFSDTKSLSIETLFEAPLVMFKFINIRPLALTIDFADNRLHALLEIIYEMPTFPSVTDLTLKFGQNSILQNVLAFVYRLRFTKNKKFPALKVLRIIGHAFEVCSKCKTVNNQGEIAASAFSGLEHVSFDVCVCRGCSHTDVRWLKSIVDEYNSVIPAPTALYLSIKLQSASSLAANAFSDNIQALVVHSNLIRVKVIESIGNHILESVVDTIFPVDEGQSREAGRDCVKEYHAIFSSNVTVLDYANNRILGFSVFTKLEWLTLDMSAFSNFHTNKEAIDMAIANLILPGLTNLKCLKRLSLYVPGYSLPYQMSHASESTFNSCFSHVLCGVPETVDTLELDSKPLTFMRKAVLNAPLIFGNGLTFDLLKKCIGTSLSMLILNGIPLGPGKYYNVVEEEPPEHATHLKSFKTGYTKIVYTLFESRNIYLQCIEFGRDIEFYFPNLKRIEIHINECDAFSLLTIWQLRHRLESLLFTFQRFSPVAIALERGVKFNCFCAAKYGFDERSLESERLRTVYKSIYSVIQKKNIPFQIESTIICNIWLYAYGVYLSLYIQRLYSGFLEEEGIVLFDALVEGRRKESDEEELLDKHTFEKCYSELMTGFCSIFVKSNYTTTDLLDMNIVFEQQLRIECKKWTRTIFTCHVCKKT